MTSTQDIIQSSAELLPEDMRTAFLVFARLSQASRNSAVDYLNYLASKEAEAKAKHFKEGAEAIRSIIGDDIPWTSEEEMIAELTAERRKKRAMRRAERESRENETVD